MSPRAVLILCCWLLVIYRVDAGETADAAGDPVRSALRETPPLWYDNERDGWRRVEVRVPAKPVERELRGGGSIGGLFSWLMLGAVIAATAWLIWQLVRSLGPRQGGLPVENVPRAAVRAAADLSALPFAAAEGARDPERALAEALKHGDWKRAVAWSYVLHLVALDQAGVIRLAKGVTNRRYLHTVTTWADDGAGRGPAPAALAASIAVFERVWFGQQPVGQEQVQALEQDRKRLGRVLTAQVSQ